MRAAWIGLITFCLHQEAIPAAIADSERRNTVEPLLELWVEEVKDKDKDTDLEIKTTFNFFLDALGPAFDFFWTVGFLARYINNPQR